MKKIILGLSLILGFSSLCVANGKQILNKTGPKLLLQSLIGSDFLSGRVQRLSLKGMKIKRRIQLAI